MKTQNPTPEQVEWALKTYLDNADAAPILANEVYRLQEEAATDIKTIQTLSRDCENLRAQLNEKEAEIRELHQSAIFTAKNTTELVDKNAALRKRAEDAEAIVAALIKAVEEIDAQIDGVLNNAFECDAPDILANVGVKIHRILDITKMCQ